MPGASRPPLLRRRMLAGLHLGGWALYGVMYYLTLRAYQPFPDPLWKQTLIATGTGLALSALLGAGYWAIRLRQRSLLGEVAIALVGSAATGLLWYQVKTWGVEWISPFIAPISVTGIFRPGEGSILSSAPAFPTLMLVWSGFYLSLAHWRGEQVAERRRLQADAEAQRARLRALRYQLNPHFFFNALNTIGALAEEDPSRVKTAVRELSGFLRYKLLDDEELEAPLRDEIAAAKHYLAIEKIRFENDLNVTVNVTEDAGRQVVPSFLVLPLVENAVKHGQRASPTPLRVRLCGTLDSGALRIEVANTGRWRDGGLGPNGNAARPDGTGTGPNGTGTGLSNVQDRLQALYPDQHQLEITDEDGWVQARIEIQRDALKS